MLQYVVRAAGVPVGKTTLAAQTIAFIQELSETVSKLDKVCVVLTLPSSANEQIDDEIANKLLEKIQKVSGRTEEKIVPISENEIPNIIRARLFVTSNEEIKKNAAEIVSDFVNVCEKEKILPQGMLPSKFRELFLNTYRSSKNVLSTKNNIPKNIQIYT